MQRNEKHDRAPVSFCSPVLKTANVRQESPALVKTGSLVAVTSDGGSVTIGSVKITGAQKLEIQLFSNLKNLSDDLTIWKVTNIKP